MTNQESSSPPSSTEGRAQPWDTLRITASGGIDAVALHVYPSGNIKVRCPSGHIIIIRPSEVIANLGYRKSEYDGLIEMLINNKYYGKGINQQPRILR